jgi:3-hydroxyacyl-[acyl-carrier-protein] dehydratase
MFPTTDAIHAVQTAIGSDGKANGAARFKPDLPVLAGHFPGNPLIPGVYVLALVAEVARRTGVAVGDIQSIEKAKWSAPIFPDEDLTITLTSRQLESGWRVDGEVSKGSTLCASCRLVLGG